MSAWVVEHLHGSAADLFLGSHSSAALLSQSDVEARLRFLHVSGPTIVLGSSQSDELFADSNHPYDRVRRRSGGGAVWLDPAEQVWLDVIVPSSHPEWISDVTRSFGWLGRVWLEALASLGVPRERLSVHEGGMQTSQWSDLLCFSGIGPGEVFIDHRKVVGISQRRSRAGALFQCGALLHWTFDPTVFTVQARQGRTLDVVERAGIGLEEVVPDATAHDIEAAVLAQMAQLGSQTSASE